MSDLDLTEAHIAALEVADREAPGIIRAEVIYDIVDAAIAVAEAQVRERIAADIEAMRAEGPWPPWFQAAVRETARIARGPS